MQLKKRMVSILSLLLLSGGVLSACGSLDSEETSTEETTATEAKVEKDDEMTKIVFWSGATKGNRDQIYEEELINEYAEKNNLEVDYQLFNWDQLKDKIVTSVVAEDAPSITWGLGEWYGEFRDMGALANLTSFWEAYEDNDKYYENVIEALSTDNVLYALPNYIAPRALVYHEDLLKEAGFDKAPETWADLIEMGAMVKDVTGQYAFGIAGTGDRAPQELASFIFQNDILLADNMGNGKYKNTWQDSDESLSRAIEVFQFYKDLLANEVIDPNSAVGGWEELDTNFSLGKYAMVNNGSWMQNYEENNPEEMADVFIGLPPYNKKPATFLEINTYYVYNNDEKEVEASVGLIEFLLQKENQQGGRPEGSARIDMEIEENNKWAVGFANSDLIEQSQPLPPISMAEIIQPMQDSIAMVLQNDDSPEEAAIFLSDKINEALENQGVLVE